MLQKFVLCSADNTIHHCSPKTMLLILPLLAYVGASNTFQPQYNDCIIYLVNIPYAASD